ncbi:MAG TPA: hypothetical protein PLK75_02300 [Bacteroidales bacterium]|nr:hypothetical protein [Bacteroidales bacterium]
MRTLIIGLITFLFSGTLFSQSVTPVDIPYFNVGAYGGKIQIHQSDKIENFYETYVGINKKRNGFYGYRVKIFADVGPTARKEANDIKVRFNSSYPEYKAYLIYNEPNFEVHCGNFRTRIEAMALLSKIKNAYPGSFIIYEIIEFPNL